MIIPKLITENKNREYLEIAKKYANLISKNKGVVGIAIGGGLGRGHSDNYSDIDIYVYLDESTYKKWKKKAPIKEGCHNWMKHKLETEFINYMEALKKNWSIEDRWEKQHHFTLFDTNNKIRNLIRKKCVWGINEKQELLKERLHRAKWYLELPGDFINRGDLEQAHYLVNVVIDWILDIVLLKNNYFIPWAKWKFHYAKLMQNKPRNFESIIREAMKIKSFDSSDVLRRMHILNRLLKEL